MRAISRVALALVLLLLAVAAPRAQLMDTYFGPGGFTSGPPPVPCTNQLVLDYSNSCALIGQGWGE